MDESTIPQVSDVKPLIAPLRFARTPRTPEKLVNYVMWQYISDSPEYQQSTVWFSIRGEGYSSRLLFNPEPDLP